MQFAYKVINLLFEYESQKGFFNKNLVQSQSADFTQQRKLKYTHLETEGPTERKQGQILITDFTIWTTSFGLN